ncbi:MAG TPA: hypothetical protein VMF52_20965 [Steroidobacteraceae bacterium]|nr:hypothetical protein [Steroidobacteraceae bacterium]
MNQFRVISLRAFAAALLVSGAWPAFAQAPAAPAATAPATALSAARPAASAPAPSPSPQPATPPPSAVPPSAIAPVPKSPEASRPVAVESEAQKKQVQAALEKSDQWLAAGKFDEAIALLEDTDRKVAGDSLVAASLGTAFELKGDLERALEWVRESAKRDASQHKGSEWLHGRILEAKLAVRENPRWLDRNRVLELDFGTGDVPTAPEILPIENGRIKGAQQLIDQVRYQIAERSKFEAPPNPFIGDLHASVGDLMISGALTPLDGGKDDPVPDYEAALKFGAPNAALIQKRLAKYRADVAALPPPAKEDVAEYPVVSKRFDRGPEQTSSLGIYLGIAAGVTILLIAVGFFVDRRRRKHAEANPPPPLPEFEGDLRRP